MANTTVSRIRSQKPRGKSYSDGHSTLGTEDSEETKTSSQTYSHSNCEELSMCHVSQSA